VSAYTGRAVTKQIILSGFESAFLPFHVKQQYLRKVSQELAAFPERDDTRAAPPRTAATTGLNPRCTPADAGSPVVEDL
jgi:hypothetical protein